VPVRNVLRHGLFRCLEQVKVVKIRSLRHDKGSSFSVGKKQLGENSKMDLTLENIRRKIKGRTFAPTRLPPPSAAVLIPLVETPAGLSVLYEVRNGAIPQGKDVSFPGGQMEKNETPEQAALRETCEELILDPSEVEVLAPMHRTKSPYGGKLYSCLGYLRRIPDRLQPDEVERIFTVPLEWLLRTVPESYDTVLTTIPGEDFPFDDIQNGRNYSWGKAVRPVYFYRTGTEIIWGITAELTYAFVQSLKEKGET
jgi:coenzyme A diphosphatase NUDT7